MYSFYSDDSYEPLNCGPDFCLIKKKPPIVPPLNLSNLPEYETSSEEEEAGAGEEEDESSPSLKPHDDESGFTGSKQPGAVNMSTQDYQKSIKYIENYYNQQ
jgi:hypothetical protein